MLKYFILKKEIYFLNMPIKKKIEALWESNTRRMVTKVYSMYM